MPSSFGNLLTRWTVRAALAGYFIGAGLRQAPSAKQRRIARAAWTLGCLFYLAHVACAFQFVHHWSHAHAVERTADETAAVTGWRWGGGIYFNYLFTALWISDSLLPAAVRLLPLSAARRLSLATQAFLWFMVFNATVVFGHGAVRWFGLVGCGGLLLVAGQRFARRRRKR